MNTTNIKIRFLCFLDEATMKSFGWTQDCLLSLAPEQLSMRVFSARSIITLDCRTNKFVSRPDRERTDRTPRLPFDGTRATSRTSKKNCEQQSLPN